MEILVKNNVRKYDSLSSFKRNIKSAFLYHMRVRGAKFNKLIFNIKNNRSFKINSFNDSFDKFKGFAYAFSPILVDGTILRLTFVSHKNIRLYNNTTGEELISIDNYLDDIDSCCRKISEVYNTFLYPKTKVLKDKLLVNRPDYPEIKEIIDEIYSKPNKMMIRHYFIDSDNIFTMIVGNGQIEYEITKSHDKKTFNMYVYNGERGDYWDYSIKDFYEIIDKETKEKRFIKTWTSIYREIVIPREPLAHNSYIYWGMGHQSTGKSLRNYTANHNLKPKNWKKFATAYHTIIKSAEVIYSDEQ